MCAEGTSYFRPSRLASLSALSAAFTFVGARAFGPTGEARYTLPPSTIDVCYAADPAPFGESHRRRINRLRGARVVRRRT
jgi:hypothetical protein